MKVLGTKIEIELDTLVSRNTGHFPEIIHSKASNILPGLHGTQQMSSPGCFPSPLSQTPLSESHLLFREEQPLLDFLS